MEREDFPEDALGSDPEENLRIENELLKLKMQAELGSTMHGVRSMPPEIENAFLKNILAFEKASTDQKVMTVFNKLGRPDFEKAGRLNDQAIVPALAKLEDLLLQNQIQLSYSGNYSERLKYTFITEELFNVEMQALDAAGMMHYSYEEFHPDHDADMKSLAEDFIKAWFSRSITEENWELSNYFILPEGKVMKKKTVVNQIQNIFGLSVRFIGGRYDLIDSSFELMDEGKGMGYVEGVAGYRMILSNGESEIVSGPFKLYFALAFGYWQIVHIVFPGFTY